MIALFWIEQYNLYMHEDGMRWEVNGRNQNPSISRFMDDGWTESWYY